MSQRLEECYKMVSHRHDMAVALINSQHLLLPRPDLYRIKLVKHTVNRGRAWSLAEELPTGEKSYLSF